MNPHIELVKKWRADDTSVTLEELEANKKDAYAACDVADWAYEAALWAFRAAESDKLENAEHYKKLAIKAIAEYEESTK